MQGAAAVAITSCGWLLRTHLRRLVGEQRVLCCLLAVHARLELRQVAVVVALHLEVEHLGLPVGGSGDEVLVQQLQDAEADLTELLLNLQQKQGLSVANSLPTCTVGAC